MSSDVYSMITSRCECMCECVRQSDSHTNAKVELMDLCLTGIDEATNYHPYHIILINFFLFFLLHYNFNKLFSGNQWIDKQFCKSNKSVEWVCENIENKI